MLGSRSGLIAWFVLALSLTYFFGISVSKALDLPPIDFNVLFGGAKAFVSGGDPYLSEDIRHVLGWPVDREIGVQVTLPALFVIIAPLAALPIETTTASDIWFWLGVVCVFASVLLLPRLGRIGKFTDTWVLVLIAACLLLGSFRAILWLGNTDIFALFFLLLGLIYAFSDRPMTAALPLIVAMSLKIHSVGLFAVFLFFRGRRALSIVAISGWLGVNLVAAAVLGRTAPGWLESWRNAWGSEAAVIANGMDPSNLELHLFTHLRAGMYAITGDSASSGVVAVLVCLTLFAVMLFSGARAPSVVRSSNAGQLLLLELSVVALVSQLIVYHRAAGAVFLVLPIAWAMASWALGRDRLPASIVATGCLAVGMFNTQFSYHSQVLRGAVPDWIAHSRLGEIFAAYHVVWIDLAMLILLVFVHVKTRVASSVQGGSIR